MKTQTKLRALGLLLFVATCLGAAVFLLSRVGTDVLPGGDTYKFEARVADAVALAAAADVRQAGVKIGRVKGVEERGAVTGLELELEGEYGPVYRDATVLIRAKSIAEENYVELNPGTPEAGELPEGGALAVSRELEATQNDDVFSILDERRRDSLRRTLTGLGRGLDDGGGRDLNRTLEAMTATVDEGSPFARILAEERSHIARVVDSFGTVSRALGERADAIRILTRSAKAEAEAVSARDSELAATLDALPGLLSQARETATRLGGFSAGATPVMRDLRLATEALVPTMSELRPAAREARRTVGELDRFASVGLGAFERLDPFAAGTERFVAPFGDFLREFNPFVDYLDPYWRELTTWFADTGGATSQRDAIGNFARVTLPVSRSNFPTLIPPAIDALIDSSLGGLDTRGTNAYPAPGEAGTPAPPSGEYPRLEREDDYSK